MRRRYFVRVDGVERQVTRAAYIEVAQRAGILPTDFDPGSMVLPGSFGVAGGVHGRTDTATLRPVPEVTAEQENARFEPLASGPGFNAVMVRKDPVEPVPVGTFVVMCFRVTGYDPDCDGSLMARLEHVDKAGEPTGWEPSHLGLYPDTDLVVEWPGDLWPDGAPPPDAAASAGDAP